jgi:hypothetical protein
VADLGNPADPGWPLAEVWPDGSTRTPITVCWHCDRPLDAASGFGPTEGMQAHPGAISLCLYCGAVAEFGPDLILYPLTAERLEELSEDKDFMRTYQQFAWARQYVMIRHNLLRDREGPDQ